MPAALVIVESPAKANTIARYLGSEYTVESSIGHVRDLPQNAGDVPKAYKDKPWARLGIDVEHGFKPLYVVSPDKRKQITKLKKLLAQAEVLYLATDEDREGEAIAWHLQEVLKPPKRMEVKRMVFHEITAPAIRAAIESPRDVDRRLVNSQEARRILDRLYGYEVSPVLWKKIQPRLSAGRVQSVATRIVVERERERMAFVAAEYWSLTATFATDTSATDTSATEGDAAADGPREFQAALVAVDGRPVATGASFDRAGRLKNEATVSLDEAAARGLITALADTSFTVRSVEKKPYRRRPAAPFMTSTLQQEASRKLRMSATVAMRTAQSLYEKGFITYMRTDSTTLSNAAHGAARDTIRERFGDQYLPASPRRYASRVKNAQEAHEAIRPAGDRFRPPEEVSRTLPRQEAALYDLIWKRTVASQMTDTVGSTVHVRAGGTAGDGRDTEFAAAGTTITHYGFRRVYSEGTDDNRGAADKRPDSDSERQLPALADGDAVDARAIEPAGHATQPPARFTEASLVRQMETLGVGRPSTYATIMTTIQDRGYVWKKGTALVPTFTAFSVVNLLERHFSDLVDYAFTARMEDELDNIAIGDEQVEPWLSRFYFGADGNGDPGLKAMVSDRLGEIDARAVNSVVIGGSDAGDDGDGIVVRVGRYGTYLQRGEARANVPDEVAPDELTLQRALELIQAPSEDRVLGAEPDSGLPVIARAGRFGPYVQVGEADSAAKTKPKTASLLASMSLETVTLDDALKVLSLPREVGTAADGIAVTVQNGRYGPYIKKGTDNRTLESEDLLFTITLDECERILAQPKRRRSQAAKGPLKELGNDPATDRPMVIKEGRFGPYVTDGETNASLRTGDSVETITPERAAELLVLRRERGPAPKRRTTTKRSGTTKRATPTRRRSTPK